MSVIVSEAQNHLNFKLSTENFRSQFNIPADSEWSCPTPRELQAQNPYYMFLPKLKDIEKSLIYSGYLKNNQKKFTKNIEKREKKSKLLNLFISVDSPPTKHKNLNTIPINNN